MVDFTEYQCFDPGVDRPLHEVSRSQARQHFELLMEKKNARIDQLRGLVLKEGIRLDDTDVSVQKLNDWYFNNVEPSQTEQHRLKPIWYCVVNDIALFLGEVIFKRAPNLKWEFYTHDRNDASYHRPAIMGFSKIKNKKYNVDLDWIIGTYGHRIVMSEEKRKEFFVEIVRSAIKDA